MPPPKLVLVCMFNKINGLKGGASVSHHQYRHEHVVDNMEM